MTSINTSETVGAEGKALGKRTLIQASVVALVAIVVVLLWRAAEVFLVVFAGVLLAVFFHSLSKWISQKTRLPERWSLAAVLLTLTLVVVVGMWFTASDISAQIDQLMERIPKAVRQLQQQVLKYEWARTLLEQKDQLEAVIPDGSNVVSTTTGIFSSTFGALANLVIALAIGIFLAVSPRMYINGLVQLIPRAKRPRTKEVLQAIGSALESWLLAKVVAMLAVGVLTTFGLWVIGIELALILGFLAAILTFIPNIGPILALVPAVLLALMSGPDKIVYVVLLYTGIQTVESYVLTPLLQQRMVDLPPALTISMQVLFGVLAGGLGVILATPLTAAAMVAIKMMYVEDILEDCQSGSAS